MSKTESKQTLYREHDITVNFLKYMYNLNLRRVDEGVSIGFSYYEFMFDGITMSVTNFHKMLTWYATTLKGDRGMKDKYYYEEDSNVRKILRDIDIKNEVNKAYKLICDWFTPYFLEEPWIVITYRVVMYHISKLGYNPDYVTAEFQHTGSKARVWLPVSANHGYEYNIIHGLHIKYSEFSKYIFSAKQVRESLKTSTLPFTLVALPASGEMKHNDIESQLLHYEEEKVKNFELTKEILDMKEELKTALEQENKKLIIAEQQIEKGKKELEESQGETDQALGRVVVCRLEIGMLQTKIKTLEATNATLLEKLSKVTAVLKS